MDGNLPWNMILAGAAIAVVIEILGIPVMPVAVGLYLPLRTTSAIMVGGLIRHWYEKRRFAKEEDRKEAIDKGILYTSGMIAGEGLVGIILAILAVFGFGSFIDLSGFINLPTWASQIGSLIVFALIILCLLKFSLWKKTSKKSDKK